MKPTFDTRKPYGGLTRSLVIAIDVGTTFSGVSYAILEPGEVPKIHGVTRFPGQEHVAGNSKIPSILYYDKRGDLKAAGAEADANQIQALAEDENWHKVELFKLRLRPRTMTLSMNGLRLAPLPARKSPVHIFGDFLSYLYNCTTSFIETTHANGPALLDSVIPNHVEFVLAHPNGWEGAQQAKMRRAAVYGKLVSDTPEGRARIRFVTEGEASLHACVLSGLAADVLSSPSKHGFLIADAGGGTLDISSYAIKGTSPLVIEEIAPPDCVFAGSVFVSRRARDFFEQKLKGSQYGTPDSLDHITRQFDEKTKRLFRDRKEPQFVPFGSPFDKDPAFGIRNGQLRLTGAEVANLFEPSIDAAFNAIRKQIESAVGGSVKSVFLVGGYAASPWLFSQLKERLKALNIVVSRPDTQTSKAVADGAIGFYCDHHVSARMSKFTYGVEYLRQLDPNDPEHVAREAKLCELPSGPKLLPDAFDCILDRGVRVKESKVFSRKYCTELTSLSMLKVFEVEVWCYRGGNGIPKWIERSSDSFSTLCMVRADLSMLSDSAEPKQGKNGKTYWTIVFSVEIHFGLTEFEARIKWVQDGHTKYGPATIVFNERGHRSEEEEPDFYPEDDSISGSNSYSSSSRASDRDHHRSSSTRAKTPPEGHYVDSSRRSSRADSVIPEVARAPSTRPSASIPNTPRSSAHMSLDRSRDLTRDLDRDSLRDRENSRRRSGTPSISDHRSSRSNRNSVVAPPASIPTSPVPRSRPGTPGTPARGLADPPRSVVASPAKPDPAPLADTDPTPTNATPPGFHATPPPPAPTLSRAASSASAILGSRSPPKTLSVFGEDPKSVFGTPGTADFLNGAGVGLGIEGLNSTDRPASIFGEDLVPGGTAGGAPASLFGSPAPGMPGGLFDEAPVSSTPITEQPAPGGGWGFGFGAGIAKSIGSIRSGKSSAKASPAISRVPSTSAKVQSALSPLNPAAQEQQQPLALEQQPEAPPVSAPEPAPTPALAPEPAALPKIDTSVPVSAIPSGLASVLAESGAATPTSDAETPVTAGGTKKKKKKGGKKAEGEEKKKKEVEDKAKEEAEAAAAADAPKKLQEEEEVKAKVQAEEEAKQKAEAELAAAAVAEAEAKEVQEEEDQKRLEAAAKKEEDAKASKAKPLAKSLSKKEKKKQEERERQEKEEKERLEREEQKKKDDEEKERLRLLEEEEKKAESVRLEQERIAEEERKAEAARLEQARLEEEAKKAGELRIEAERAAAEEKAEAERKAEEEKQRAAAELLEKERLAEEKEKKREEEIRVERERVEKMRLEEEQIQKELAELERQEKEAKEAEERRRQEAEDRRRQEIQEREKRENEAKERREREKRERDERERQSKPSGFGSLWGGKATSFTSTLFGAVSPEPPQQETNDNAFGWGGFGGGLKKKASSTSLAKPTPPPLSKRSSRQFDQSGWGSTLGSSGFDFGSGTNNPTAANSFFGDANINFETDIGLKDLKNPAAGLGQESKPSSPPAKDEHDGEDAWGFVDEKKDLAKEKPLQPPSPEALHHPYKGAEGVDGESAAEGAWGLSTLSGKDKKKRKGKAAELAGSELPTRTSSPAPPESSADGFATPMGVSEAEPEPVTADEDFGFPLKTKKKKKGKKGADVEEPSGAATPVPGAVGTGGDLGINVQEKLGDLLGGDAEQAATPTAEKEDDDWGLPVKTKKKKNTKAGKKK